MPDAIATLDHLRAALQDLPTADAAARAGAAARNGQLTKPPAALGRLEELALWLAGWQGVERPRIRAPQIVVFAGNHGVSAQGVSAFPAEVTGQMVANFAAGGAAVNQIARVSEARLDVVALDLDRPTQDFTRAPALSETELCAALSAGWAALGDATDLLIPGEMGIGNTTSAAALSCALFGGSAGDWVGPGTGLDETGLARKTKVVAAGLDRHREHLHGPFEALRRLGGRELAAIAGAVLHARHRRVPVLLDGFIATAAAAVLARAVPNGLDHAVAAHQSPEPGHGRLLAALGLTPILDLGLRLGEGSGAGLAIPILRAAAACQSDMATFAEAQVASGSD